jgi:hypothetical protein
MRYAEPVALGDLLDLEPSGATLVRAELVLDMASAAVRAAAKSLDATIDGTSETVTLDAAGTVRLVLPSWPVTAVASVVVEGVTLPASEYEWTRMGVLKRVYGVWPLKLASVAVTFTHGYTSLPAAVADALKSVTLAVAARAWSNPSGLVRMQIGSYSEQHATTSDGGALTEQERAAILGVLA